LGFFRVFFGLVAIQEVVFLLYFRHLIFDPVPFIDRASPILHFFLLVWFIVLLFLIFGLFTRKAALWNYAFWVIFVVFTPMWQDFDGGFDQLMTGVSFLLIFLPSEKAFSLDRLRVRLQSVQLSADKDFESPKTSVLSYTLTLGLSLGLLYLDSGIHKLSSEFWRNGMGGWLPPSMPYYMSPLDMSPLLNNKLAEEIIGYSVIAFQLSFLFLFWKKSFRIPLLILGVLFHVGIILSLNVYPFGFAMLSLYTLLVPFSWWTQVGKWMVLDQPKLTVLFDKECPLCRRTVISLSHFDLRRAIVFKPLQDHAREYRALDDIPEEQLLKDLYALDQAGRLHRGLDTYTSILIAMGYLAPVGWILKLPIFHHLGNLAYRKIADSRTRIVCNLDCLPIPTSQQDDKPFSNLYNKFAATPSQTAQRITKFLVLVLVLQLNCTLHYGLLYRWASAEKHDPVWALLGQVSDSVINFSHTFLGISPHALYLHDHFDNYNNILAITYLDNTGQETWLPFINQEGRLLSPNWGRVQSMWANVAVTSHMERARLEKFIRKITAFYANEMGIRLDGATFSIKEKRVEVPTVWTYELRHQNAKAPWHDFALAQWQGDSMTLSIKPTGSGLTHLEKGPRSLQDHP
jgi:predicted DCC family thiol-disulfide oxidoreductase YuxK